MLTAHDVRGARFARTRFREGYEMREVDDLLDRAAATLDALAAGRPGVVTARDVADSRFMPTKFRDGYDQDQVDDFLDLVVAALAGASGAPDGVEAGAGTAGDDPAGTSSRTLLEAHAAERAARSFDGDALRAAVPPVTRRGPGYARADVDTFVERAARALDDARLGRPAGLTARDVRGARFAEAGWRADRYDQYAVDELLDRVEAALLP